MRFICRFIVTVSFVGSSLVIEFATGPYPMSTLTADRDNSSTGHINELSLIYVHILTPYVTYEKSLKTKSVGSTN